MRDAEKEMSMGEYFSYLSHENHDLFDETVRPKVGSFPREWTEYFLCYRKQEDSPYCLSDLEPDTFCKDRVRID